MNISSLRSLLASAVVVAVVTLTACSPSTPEPARVLDDDTRMGAIELLTADLDLLGTFYGDVVGLDEMARDEEMVSFGAHGEELIRLVLADTPADDPREAGLYHSAILYPDEASLAAALMRSAQFAPESFQGASDHLVSQAFYFADPEGNGVELYVDRPRDEWEWKDNRVTMGSVYVDPNEFIQTHLGGAEAAPTMGHVHLRVGDIDTARDFYAGVLGFDVTSEDESALFLSAGGYHHHLAANVWSSAGADSRPATRGLGAVTIVAANDAEIDGFEERLETANVEVTRDADGVRTVDPWGTVLRITTTP